MDQTVEGQKRSRPETVDLTDDEYFPPKEVARYEAPEDAEQNELGLDSTMTSTSARWEESEELNALLNIMLKPLPRFERRAIVRELPRPISDAAWTPSLDNYFPSMVNGVKVADTPLRETQDKVLDILGPLCTLYENMNVLHDSISQECVSLDKTFTGEIHNCVKKATLLVEDTSAQLSTRRREQVLSKLNPCLASLGKGDFPQAGKELFGTGFESRLKLRTETANTVAKAKKAGKSFFFPELPAGTSQGFTWVAEVNLAQALPFQTEEISTSPAISEAEGEPNHSAPSDNSSQNNENTAVST